MTKGWDRTLTIKISKSCIKGNYIYLPRRFRDLFPTFGAEFSLKTDSGTLPVHITSERNLPYGYKSRDESVAGNNIYGKNKNMAQWYAKHPELKAGQTIILKEIKEKKVYQLRIVRWS